MDFPNHDPVTFAEAVAEDDARGIDLSGWIAGVNAERLAAKRAYAAEAVILEDGGISVGDLVKTAIARGDRIAAINLAQRIWHRSEDRSRLQSHLSDIVKRHFISLVPVEPLAKGSGVKCRTTRRRCSRAAKSTVNGTVAACWQHEQDAVVEASIALRTASGIDEALGVPIGGYRGERLTVAEKWSVLNSDLAAIRALPLNDALRKLLDTLVADFSAKWEGLDNG